jgi:hypothetical protein
MLRPSSWLFLALMVGCGGNETNQLPPVNFMDGGNSADVAIAPLPDGFIWPGSEVGGKDSPSNDVPIDTDEGDANTSIPPLSFRVEILKPEASTKLDGSMADGGLVVPIIAKSQKLAPEVRVTVESQTSDATEDILSKVTASLNPVKGQAATTSTKLIQTQFDRTAETNTAVYLFANQNLDLAALASGLYRLDVVAKTIGNATAIASMQVFIDAGPNIQFVQPVEDSSWKGSMIATLLIDDDYAQVTGVALTIGQTAIDAKAILNNNDRYSATIDFNSFNPPLEGVQLLTVDAVNGHGIHSTSTRRFIVDTQGPSITDTSPAIGGMIGRVITLQAKVADTAGVLESSVVAVVAHGDSRFQVTLEKGKDDIFQKQFDTTQLPIHAIFPTISFRAQDVLGNQSTIAYDVSLDNTPPLLDLDPPNDVRLLKEVDKRYVCSWPFDPVGPDAVDDGSVVKQLFDIRARIEDKGNTPLTGSADFIPVGGVDPKTVGVLILDDISNPLVVDTSDPPDGICDAINPELIPSTTPKSSKDAQYIGMVSLAPYQGAGNYSSQKGVACSGTEEAPKPFCGTTYNAIKRQYLAYTLGYAGDLPSIWTVAPVVADGLQCAGRQFDASNNLKDGWACVAAVASDTLGNNQVSRPIRICLEVTPKSTACSPQNIGAIEIAKTSLSLSSTGEIFFTTKTPLLTASGSPLKNGDLVILAEVDPKSILNGTHAIEPVVGEVNTYKILGKTMVPPQLYTNSGPAGQRIAHGAVGVVIREGEPVTVLTDSTSALPAGYIGKVLLENVVDQPMIEELGELSVSGVSETGFTLVGVIGAPLSMLSGYALAESKLPNCTGTAVAQGSQLPPLIDGSKTCRPWDSYHSGETRWQK